MTQLHYAIGDVHGRDDLLEAMHQRIAAYHKVRHPGRSATVVHIGDYVDGGANSLGVIDRLMRGLEGFKWICLMGNHEDLMLRCLETDNRHMWWTWLSNGGNETLASLGVSIRFGGYDPSALAEALGERRIAWLRSLPHHHRADDYLFVHAGIVPGTPLERQKPKDMMWIRNRFLDSEEDYGFCVVHGHTTGDAPVVRPNRICIDTGATSNGRLTAVVLGEAEGPKFLTVEGVPGKGR